MNRQQFFESILRSSDEEKFQNAITAIDNIRVQYPNLDEFYTFMRVTTAIFAGVDKTIKTTEWQIYTEATGDRSLSKDEFFKMVVNVCSAPNYLDTYFKFYDSFDADFKTNVAVYALSLVTFDDHLAKEEVELLNRFIPEGEY